MNMVLEIKEQKPYFLFQSPPPPIPASQYSGSGFNLNNKVSPSVLLIIIIIAIIFFISGLLHLLVRFLLRPPNRDPDEMENVTALQGQLHQLFHLHDSGVDQSFIDTLPVFNYKAIIGVKDPFDCAVCLCEFEGEDKLRLLPKCSHAFHMDCIDTWLLSHSTCPLCRATLLPDFNTGNTNCCPIVLLLESGGESSRDIVSDRDVARVNSPLSPPRDDECGDDFKLHHADIPQDSCEIHEGKKVIMGSGEKVVSVKLGKFKNLDDGSHEDGSSSVGETNADARRCFSMGSFAYVMDENLSLQVPIRNTPMKKQISKKPSMPLTPGHRQAMSECGFDSRVEFNGFEAFRILEIQGDEKGTSGNSHCNGNKSIGRSKRESLSVSEILLRDRKDRPNGVSMESSRRAVSFRFPLHQNPVGANEIKPKNGSGCGRTISEIGISRWRNGGEDEQQSCNSLDSETNAPSYARRTLLWLMGRQNKVVHSTFSSNV
ncbi:RING-H2 finger protein ATL13-like [Primulina eburnea]|uniref:RING-H2 finger protein ATL13-like n=1 Tax=Primulina eburnea TaxID=1245227 RepID=UPI003C6CBB12